jgi:predicted Zn-dependent peptidase
MEERRLGENDPHQNLFEHLDLVSFSYHPYRNPIIGFMSDIERLTRDDVYNWYKKYYNPANAIIIIAGDVNPEEALRLVKKYYGNIKGKKEQDILFEEPPQNGEKRFELKKDIRTPALAIQYHAVGLNHEDMYVLDVISMILSFGMSSRFEKNLVREAGIATTINTYSSTLKYGGSFSILGIPQKGVDIELLEKEIYNEIEKLKKEPVTDEELKKAKNQVLAQMIYEQDSAARIARILGWWEIEGGAWQNINRYPEEVQKLTKEDILEVAQKYFRKDNRTVGYLLPKEEK